ncbi:MAG TPA: hypothetical protein VJT67_01660 [Longimicrobiaceae bacterium]|nr:hypothetical protein [Longimicrobiaceae bacterium]
MPDAYDTPIPSGAAALDLGAPPVLAGAELERLPGAGRAFRVQVGDHFAKPRDKRYLQEGFPGKNRADNHLQGVQRFGDFLFCTGADLTENIAHLFIVRLQTDGDGVPTGGTLERIVALDRELPHPGGLQRLGNVLIVPLQGDAGSRLVFVQVSDPANPVLLGGGSSIERPGRAKAGAAALARLPDGRLLAGGWCEEGSRGLLDLYLSRTGNLLDGFLPAVTCELTGMVQPGPAYQSIAFLQPESRTAADGTPETCVRLAGLRNTQQGVSNWIHGQNFADLYELAIPQAALAAWPDGTVSVRLVQSRAFTFGEFDGNFSAAAGLNVEADGRLTLYAAHHWRIGQELHFSTCC